MDDGTKAEQRARLHRSPLEPSLIIETKRGYQAYWSAKDARPEHWNAIVLDRLVPFFGSDKNARDLARILRAPGYKHLKVPAEPFEIREVHRCKVSYTEQQLAHRFPREVAEEKKPHAEAKREIRTQGNDFFENLWHADHRDILSRLSGCGAVRGEQYTFRRNRSGTYNIFVDGKGTSCWIDTNGRIGSLSEGGPTAVQWLKWHGASTREAVDILKSACPELAR